MQFSRDDKLIMLKSAQMPLQKPKRAKDSAVNFAKKTINSENEDRVKQMKEEETLFLHTEI